MPPCRLRAVQKRLAHLVTCKTVLQKGEADSSFPCVHLYASSRGLSESGKILYELPNIRSQKKMQTDIIICACANIFNSSSVLLSRPLLVYSVKDVNLETRTISLHRIGLRGTLFRVLVVVLIKATSSAF